MEKRTLLRTEDIRQMSLKEFMAFRHDRYNAIPVREFQEANSEWLLICDLEGVKDMKGLRKLIGQLKEDLWWNIQHGKKQEWRIVRTPVGNLRHRLSAVEPKCRGGLYRTT